MPWRILLVFWIVIMACTILRFRVWRVHRVKFYAIVMGSGLTAGALFLEDGLGTIYLILTAPGIYGYYTPFLSSNVAEAAIGGVMTVLVLVALSWLWVRRRPDWGFDFRSLIGVLLLGGVGSLGVLLAFRVLPHLLGLPSPTKEVAMPAILVLGIAGVVVTLIGLWTLAMLVSRLSHSPAASSTDGTLK